MTSSKPHKNIRGAEYYAKVAMEAMAEPATTPIMRLREFVAWAQGRGMCRSEFDFERQCSLSPKYIGNNSRTGKGNIGTEVLGRITTAYPQLNLAWLCTGNGPMLADGGSTLNADYKQAYEAAMAQIEALNRIIKQLTIIAK